MRHNIVCWHRATATLTPSTFRVLHPDEPELDVDETYWQIRETVGRLEHIVLRTLAFQVITICCWNKQDVLLIVPCEGNILYPMIFQPYAATLYLTP